MNFFQFVYNLMGTDIIIIIVTTVVHSSLIKGSDSNFEVNIFQILKVATNETSTLHLTMCTWNVLEIYNNNDQQFNRHDFPHKVQPPHWLCYDYVYF